MEYWNNEEAKETNMQKLKRLEATRRTKLNQRMIPGLALTGFSSPHYSIIPPFQTGLSLPVIPPFHFLMFDGWAILR
jgi:hypothetical protein